MTETQATYLIRVRERLDESTSKYWGDVELRRWINDAATEIARRTETLQDVDTITAVGGTAEYTLDSDVIRVYRVEFNRTGASEKYPLEWRPMNAMDSVWWTHKDITQNTPLFYTIWGFSPNLKMRLFPIPETGGALTLYVYRQPVKLSTTGSDAATILDIPQGWEDLVSDYVEYVALRKDADPRWQEAKQLFDEKLDSMYVLTRAYADQAGMMVPQSGVGFVPAWLWSDW